MNQRATNTEARKQACGSGNKRPLPPYEFECRDSRFFISSLPTAGIRATLRTHAVHYIIIGIAANRSPLFASNTKVGFYQISMGWRLASCPREDFQRVFSPLPPSTLSTADIANATNATLKKLRRKGQMIEQEGRVPTHALPPDLEKLGRNDVEIRSRIYDRAMELIDRWKTSPQAKPSPERQQKLEVPDKAASQIKQIPDSFSKEHSTYMYSSR
jgi:hypothetical protein